MQPTNLPVLEDREELASEVDLILHLECHLTNYLILGPCLASCRSKGEMSYIVVQNYMNLSEKASNSVPFSWRIKDYLEELWVHTQYITGDAGELSNGGRRRVLQEETLLPCHRSSSLFESPGKLGH